MPCTIELLRHIADMCTKVLQSTPLADAANTEVVLFANPHIRRELGEKYYRRTAEWLSGATRDLDARVKVDQTLHDCDAWEAAYDAWADASEETNGPEPREADYTKTGRLEFGVGSLGSIWFDVDLTGQVDGVAVTKKTRVALDPTPQLNDLTARPFRVMLDATFDDEF